MVQGMDIQRTRRALKLAFLFMVCCMAVLSSLTVSTLRGIVAGQRSHAQSFVPAKRLTAGFEREILNARIFFIYFVTIQKPGALENGWKRYHNGEDTLRKLNVLVNQYPELANLRAPVAKLQQDVDNYGVALTATLSMVQGGETKGPHYDAQVKEWAARGATMVADSAAVESLTFHSGEANTEDIAHALKSGQTNILLAFAACLVLSLLFARHALRKLDGSALPLKTPMSSSAPLSPSFNTGAL